MKVFELINEVHDAAEEVDVMEVSAEDMGVNGLQPISLSPEQTAALNDVKQFKRVIIGVLRFAKVFFGAKVDRILDIAIRFVELFL